ncbi:hypothetical protein NDU88_003120 [Pleurodeles waltl]|uniref:Uncharacterized protein n=1 Tax=Pleurodeles waltl TaxID=8319 RepID=A0AAV7KWL4_PLEWA|nr:hypothetical protein NDU88_003120 [Pleurodeles waltl]
MLWWPPGLRQAPSPVNHRRSPGRVLYLAEEVRKEDGRISPPEPSSSRPENELPRNTETNGQAQIKFEIAAAAGREPTRVRGSCRTVGLCVPWKLVL